MNFPFPLSSNGASCCPVAFSVNVPSTSEIAILIGILIPVTGFSQSCLSEGITFETQAQIDSFQVNYPNCTQLEGDVTISGSNITNLNGLSVVTSIEGDIEINGNDALTSLTGLENVTSIEGGIEIVKNDALIKLSPRNILTNPATYCWLQS